MSTTSVPGSTAPIPRSVSAASSSPVSRRVVEPVAPLDLAEEGLAVLGVAHRARRDAERPLRAERLELAAVLREDVANAGDREGQELAPLVDSLAEPGDLSRRTTSSSVPFASATRRRVEFVPRSTAATLTCAARRGDSIDRLAHVRERGGEDVQLRARGAQAGKRGLQLRAALGRQLEVPLDLGGRRSDVIELAADVAAERFERPEGIERV